MLRNIGPYGYVAFDTTKFILCFLEPFSLILSLALLFPNFLSALIVFCFLKEASLAFKGYGSPGFRSSPSAPCILFMSLFILITQLSPTHRWLPKLHLHPQPFSMSPGFVHLDIPWHSTFLEVNSLSPPVIIAIHLAIHLLFVCLFFSSY